MPKDLVPKYQNALIQKEMYIDDNQYMKKKHGDAYQSYKLYKLNQEKTLDSKKCCNLSKDGCPCPQYHWQRVVMELANREYGE